MQENVHLWPDALTTLKPNQKEFIRKVIDNPQRSRILTGCAGSGKTLVAIAVKVKLLLNSPGTESLVLVYTKMLEKFISDHLKDKDIPISGVEHYHTWRSDHINYDIVIVDEAQDFEDTWIENVTSNSAYQIWVGDIDQSIYKNAKDTGGYESLMNEYSSMDISNLDVNHRNTLNIAKFASNFIQLNEYDEISIQEKKRRFVEPTLKNESGARNQPVFFIEVDDKGKEIDCIVRTIEIIQKTKRKSKQIVIVQLTHYDLDIIERGLLSRGYDIPRIPRDNKESILETIDFTDPDLVLLSTAHSLKGLEFDYVIYPRSDSFSIHSKAPVLNIFFMLFARAKTGIYCSYVNRNNSLVYKIVNMSSDDSYYKILKSDEFLSSEFDIEPSYPDDSLPF